MRSTQVSLKSGVEADAARYEDFCKVHSSNAAEAASLLSTCGVARLLAKLQELQLEHVLGKRSDIMTKIAEKMQAIEPQLQVLHISPSRPGAMCLDAAGSRQLTPANRGILSMCISGLSMRRIPLLCNSSLGDVLYSDNTSCSDGIHSNQ